MSLPVRDVMSKPVKVLREDATLLDAMTFMHENRIRHLPVVDGTGKLVGVLTDRDVKRASPSALMPGQHAVWEKVVNETRLSRIMSKKPITVAPHDPIATAARLFVEEKIGCVPVVESGQIVGIVTARDLLKAMLKLLERTQS